MKRIFAFAATLCVLFAQEAFATCEESTTRLPGTGHTSGSAHNVGLYVWDNSLGAYRLEDSYYASSLAPAIPADIPAPYLIPSGGPGGPGDGGGGSNEPQTGTPCSELPRITVTATTFPPGPGRQSGFLRMISNIFGSRHRPITAVTSQDMPNNTSNPYPADCQSGHDARIDHANNDFVTYRAAAIVGAGAIPRAGSIVEIEYDDGSEQGWVVGAPLSTVPLLHEAGAIENCPE